MSKLPSFCAKLCRFGTILTLAVAVWPLAAACTSEDPEPDGSGGATGGTGGASGGTGGTGGATGGVGALGGEGGQATCEVPAMFDAQPFEIELSADGDAGEGLGGQGGASGSGCTARTGNNPGTCEGFAEVTVGEGGPVLVLGDGSTFSWRLDDIDAGVLAEQSIVWLEYAQDWWLICPYCGTVPWSTLSIRDASDGATTFVHFDFNYESHVRNVDGDIEARMTEILGANVESVPGCTLPSQADCHVGVTTTHYDLIVDGSPEASVDTGEVTQLTTPEGTFDVYSYLYRQSGTHDGRCQDGRGLATGGSVLIIRQPTD